MISLVVLLIVPFVVLGNLYHYFSVLIVVIKGYVYLLGLKNRDVLMIVYKLYVRGTQPNFLVWLSLCFLFNLQLYFDVYIRNCTYQLV